MSSSPPTKAPASGVVVVEDGNPFAEQPWEYGEQVLVERYIPGRELSVAVMGGEPLGVIEIEPRDGFYDFDAKYAPGGSAPCDAGGRAEGRLRRQHGGRRHRRIIASAVAA